MTLSTPGSPPTSTGRCSVCGKPLHPSGNSWAERGGLAHTACVDWAAIEFPLESSLRDLRKRYLELREATKAIVAAGRWLRQFKARWPKGAAEGMDEWARMRGEVAAKIRRSLK